MDYKKHYTKLCERAKKRQLNEYVENHHIVPVCMNGSDDKSNIVELTPEEHYLAHQLLVKMYPEHSGLVWAAHMMTGKHNNHHRSNNKLYGWLKRKNQKIAKARKGSKNGSFGRHWYYNPETLENVKCIPDEVPEGFVKGRKIKNTNSKCIVCKKDTGAPRRKYCVDHKWDCNKNSKPVWLDDPSKRYDYSGQKEISRKSKISKALSLR